MGGGVIGVSCAFHLAAAGVEGVLLIEQEALGSGSTAKAAGGIRASFSTRCNIEMGLHGLAAYAEFSKRFDQEIDFHRDGYLYLLSEGCDLSALEATVSAARRHPFLRRAAVQRIWPQRGGAGDHLSRRRSGAVA